MIEKGQRYTEIPCDSWTKGHACMENLLEINHKEAVMASEILVVNIGVHAQLERKNLLTPCELILQRQQKTVP